MFLIYQLWGNGWDSKTNTVKIRGQSKVMKGLQMDLSPALMYIFIIIINSINITG